MTRYIDADAEKAEIDNMLVYGEVFITAKNFASMVLEKAPTVDAIPIDYMRSQVDSGKWEEIITRWKEHDEIH